MKRTAIVLAAIGVLWAVLALPATATDSNHVDYWCETGVKYEPVDTPFVVPEPPAGEVWTLLVLKAGSGDGQNAKFEYPTVGVGYKHPTGKDISHAILCSEGESGTTTTMATTTTSEATTTTTTEPPTTTTVPETSTTTTSSTTSSTTTSTTTSTTEPPNTTSTTEATTTTLGTTTSTTEPSSTTTSTTTPTSSSSTSTTGTPKGGVATGGGGTALPHTGLEMAEWLALAVLLLGGGGLLLAGTWRIVGSDR